MATQNVTLSCTGTGTATIKRDPSKNLSATATSVPKVLKLPARTLTITATLVGRLLKLPGKRFSVTGSNSVLISAIVFGVDTFDVFEGKRKWIVNGVNRFQLDARKRFTFLVRGKPYG